MNALFAAALGNLLVAVPLAVAAWLVGRTVRRPALAHGMWVLVLVKLVTPPLGIVPLPTFAPAVEIERLAGSPAFVWDEAFALDVDAGACAFELPPLPEIPAELAPMPVAIVEAEATPTFAWRGWVLPALGGAWALGSCAYVFFLARRLVRFRRALAEAPEASRGLRRRVRELADALGVSCPRVTAAPGVVSPMLWVWGREATLVVPRALFERLAPEQQTSLLLHELAHWRRGDHWVRRLEATATAVWWWCPLTWWARAELRQAEEECCDAWVVATAPDAARAYALALVETVDFLSEAPASGTWAAAPLASGLGPFPSLQRRLTMIFRKGTPRRLTAAGVALLAGLSATLLPWSPGLAQDREGEPRKKFDAPREGERKFDGERKKDAPRDGERRFEGERKKDGERKFDGPKDGDRKKFDAPREGDRPREGEKKFDRPFERKFDGPDGERMRDELVRRRAELEELRRVMEQKTRELHMMMEKLGVGREGGPGPGGPREGGFRPDGPREGGPRPDGPREGGPRPDGPPPGAGKGPGGDVERRLEALEGRLDAILRRLEGGRPPVAPAPPVPPGPPGRRFERPAGGEGGPGAEKAPPPRREER